MLIVCNKKNIYLILYFKIDIFIAFLFKNMLLFEDMFFLFHRCQLIREVFPMCENMKYCFDISIAFYILIYKSAIQVLHLI